VLEAAKAGKHILCEKPLTLSARDTAKAVDAARKHKVFLMEAFMYRCHPQTAKLLQLIREGKIGEVRLIQAVFCFDAPVDLKHRLFNKKLGGGGIWDVGCYPLSMARLLAGAALGKAFVEPLVVKGIGVLGRESGVDEMALASLKFPGGILAEISCGIRVDRGRSKVHVYGSQGALTVPSPWFATWRPGTSFILFQPKGGKREVKIPIQSGQPLYVWEADEAAACIRRGALESQAMGWKDSLGNAQSLDLWRAGLGRG
jgi:predicted dehydrogenase